jgi:outer membrane protein insertion porin family
MEDYKKTSHEDSSDSETGKTRSLTLEARQDTTIHPFNPTTGVINNLSLEYAGAIFGGDHDFTKYNFDLRKYVPGFRDEHAWAFRVKGGISNGNLPTLEKYRLGGSQSLRGYEDFSFLGKNMLLLNLEYRLPLDDKFTGVAFVDGGNTWETLEEAQLNQLHYSAGVGVRMNTPIGQLRLDYGWNENGNAMPHFSIGQTF